MFTVKGKLIFSKKEIAGRDSEVQQLNYLKHTFQIATPPTKHTHFRRIINQKWVLGMCGR